MSRSTTGIRALMPSMRDYRGLKRTWRGDLLGGVTVGIVALPLALGFGISSGVTAEAGLITAIVAGLIAAVFGGSNVQVSGPTGAMVVVLLPIVATHGIGAIAAVSIMAGLVVFLAGALKLGRVVSFIPWPVIEGFTLGIAVIIFLQQIPSLTAAHLPAAGAQSTNALIAAAQSLGQTDGSYILWAAGAALVVALIMTVSTKLHPSIPGSLIGIAVVTLLCLFLQTPLAVIGTLPSTLPAPSLPTFSISTTVDLIGPALTVAALAAIESLLSARVAASLADTGPVHPDRELIGQGLASIGSGLFGGMPATGAIARTAVNIRAGGRTRLASITHALVLLLVVLAFATPVGTIPLAALAGVLMVTAIRMVHVSTVRAIMRSTRQDAFAFVLTAVITISFDLVFAVAIGVVFAGVLAIRNLSRASAVEREALPGAPQMSDDRIALLRIDGPLIFTAAERVFDEVLAVRDVTVVVLRLSQVSLIDATGARMLVDITQTLRRKNIAVMIKGIQPVHRALLQRIGLVDSFRDGEDLFDDLDEAVARARMLAAA